MDLDELFSCRGRIKILLVLFEHGEMSMSELARRSGLNYTTTEKHVEVLARKGLVKERRWGRARLVSLNMEKPETRLITFFFEKWASGGLQEG